MSKKQTTGAGLNAEVAFDALVDFGLFAEKLPPCFTSEGLSAKVPTAMAKIVSNA